MSTVRVLVFCPHDPDSSIIRESLGGYTLTEAQDIPDCMGHLRSGIRFMVVILDLCALGPDAKRILGLLHDDARFNDTYLILLTDSDRELDRKPVAPETIHSFVLKPMHGDTLAARVAVHLAHLQRDGLDRKVRELQTLFDTVLWQAPIGIAISHGMCPSGNTKDDLYDVNPVFERIVGRSKEELKHLGWAAITHPEDLARELEPYGRLLAGEIDTYTMEKRYLKPDGSPVWVNIIVSMLDLPSIHSRKHVCLIQDIDDRKAIESALAESERSKSVLLTHLPGMAYRCHYDREWTMQYVSPGCRELTGYAPEDLLDNKRLSFNELIAREYREPLWNEWEQLIARRLPFKREYEISSADGTRKWVLEMGQGVFNASGEVEALEGIILDISERKLVEDELLYYHDHDLWTGLYNRRYFENLLKADLLTLGPGRLAMISVNISSAHELSIRYGFHYSRDIIKKIARALESHCNDSVQLFSTYENRFVLYVTDYRDTDALLAICDQVSETVKTILSVERIGWGIGLIEIDAHNSHDPEQLLRNLLIASERSLASFKDDFRFFVFDSLMHARIEREEALTDELSHIITDGPSDRLFLHYQPILDLGTNTIKGFEALARMHSEAFGLIHPLEFIPIAEKTKLIVPLGETIIRQACVFLKELEASGLAAVGISINISPIQLLRKDFKQRLCAIIEETQVNPKNIGLEITESIFTGNFQEVNKTLGMLRALGIGIALDDFGTGYSSLSRERELNINCIKIDRAFIHRLLTLPDDQAITGDIISMAHKLGHVVIAEGIEHPRQMRYLEAHDCDMVQGYLVSKPLGPDDALQFLATYDAGR